MKCQRCKGGYGDSFVLAYCYNARLCDECLQRFGDWAFLAPAFVALRQADAAQKTAIAGGVDASRATDDLIAAEGAMRAAIREWLAVTP